MADVVVLPFHVPRRKVILTNPFITGNPDAASGAQVEKLTKADLILIPAGHCDEIGDTVAIAKATGARVVTPFELGSWFIIRGEARVVRRNPGGRFVWEGITIRVQRVSRRVWHRLNPWRPE